ncbi:MAG: type II toxin-antitoxin system VapC family toxin [Dehalococcoidia bacterium]
MRWAFDADVLIYTAAPGNSLGQAVRTLLESSQDADEFIGSTVLVPEVLIKPLGRGYRAEVAELEATLSYLRLIPLTYEISHYAAKLGGVYGLKAVDATHLATAAVAGADRLLTNNRRDFRPEVIKEVEVFFPDALPTVGR